MTCSSSNTFGNWFCKASRIPSKSVLRVRISANVSSCTRDISPMSTNGVSPFIARYISKVCSSGLSLLSKRYPLISSTLQSTSFAICCNSFPAPNIVEFLAYSTKNSFCSKLNFFVSVGTVKLFKSFKKLNSCDV